MGKVARTEPCSTRPWDKHVGEWWCKPCILSTPGSLQQPRGLSRKAKILLWHRRSSEAPESNWLYSEQSATQYKLLCPVLSSRFDYEASRSPEWHTHSLFIWLEFEFIQECASSVRILLFKQAFSSENQAPAQSFDSPGLFWIKALTGLKFWHEILSVSRWLRSFSFIPPRTLC